MVLKNPNYFNSNKPDTVWGEIKLFIPAITIASIGAGFGYLGYEGQQTQVFFAW